MASILKVDELRGIVSAGDITVTDGSVTMKLQDGLAKAWAFFTQAFGVPTNAFADGNNNVISATTGSGESNRFVTFNLPRTTVIKIEVFRISDNSAQDAGEVSTTVHGDLA
jgi:hypothetical protein